MQEDQVGVEQIRSDLNDFAQRVDALTDRDNIRRPWPTLRILGRRNRERLWQQYLAYFSNPSRPHGFEGRFLEALLDTFTEHGTFNQAFFHPDWDSIEVETEASGAEGRPDLLIHQESRWLLCIEMKVDAEYDSDQLKRYTNATELSDVKINEYDPERRFYVYIDTDRPRGFSNHFNTEHSFQLVTWEDIVPAIDTLLSPPNEHHPARSIQQLNDFRSVIANKLDMNEDNTIHQLKDEYVKHRDAIEAADNAGEEFVAQYLAHDWVGAITPGGDYTPSFWNEHWDIHYRESQDSPGWGQIYRENWKQDGDIDIDIHFEHKPRWKHFREGRLKFTLEIEGNSDAITDINECWKHYQDEIDERTPDTMEIRSPGYRNKYMMESEEGAYSYSAGDPDAYFSALQSALEDNEAIISILNTMIDSLPIDDPETVDL